MSLCLAGITVRKDLLGVTSIVRARGLEPACYDPLLDFFHSPALDLDKLTCAWCALLFRLDPGILRVNRRPVLVGHGIKVAKAGRKMPGVKKLHQQSESNNKAEYIFGHSCQAVAVLSQALSSVFALPLACRIHEGTVFSNRDHPTLLDKMILLLDSLGLKQSFYFVADAYYACATVAQRLRASGSHLISRVRRSAVAYIPAAAPRGPRKRGRPRVYGRKLKLWSLFDSPAHDWQQADSPVYEERDVTIRFLCRDLIWRPLRTVARFVLVDHAVRGRSIFITTDLSLPPIEVIRLYGLRFKIGVSSRRTRLLVGESPTEVKRSDLVAWEAPWSDDLDPYSSQQHMCRQLRGSGQQRDNQ